MKFIGTLSLIVLTLCGFSQNDNSNHTKDFTKNDFKIQYPASWTIDTSKIMGSEVIVFSTLENENDIFRENVNIIIQDLSAFDIDLDKYAKVTENQIKKSAVEGEIFESTILKKNQIEYYKISYAMTPGNFRVKILSYCFIKNKKAYLITFTAELKEFDKYIKSGEAILNSFAFIK